MEPFANLTGVVVPLDRINIDTDQIIPKQFLKRVERTGFGQFLFFDWRYNEDGSANPKFELNQPGYENASILATGRNFGSGSSREHAAWALLDYGIRIIIAPSFADIFHKNCFENGMVPVILPEEQVDKILANAKADHGYRITVDLESCRLTAEEGLDIDFKMHVDLETHEFRRYCLLNGLDEIDLVMRYEDKITAFEESRAFEAL